MTMPLSSPKYANGALAHTWQKMVALPVFLLGLALYGLTLAPSVVTVFDDSLEFQLVTYLAGIAHPTGYPLYTLLGWLFTRLPLGDVAYRVNLMSAVFGAVTVALVYLINLELVVSYSTLNKEHGKDTRRLWVEVLAALVGALALAISPVFWSQATVAEVYTLNAALIAGMLWLLVQDKYPLSEKSLVALAFLFGLSLTHHRTTPLMLPAIIYYLWPQFSALRYSASTGSEFVPRRSVSPLQTVVKMVVALVVPLLLYLYLPLRGHVGSLDGTYTNTLEGFWKQVTASGYGIFIFKNPFGAERGVDFFLSLFLDQFGPIGFVAGLTGMVVLVRHRIGRLMVIAFGTYLVFNLFYHVADIQVFFIPLFLMWAIWIGVAAGWLLTGQVWASISRASLVRLAVPLFTGVLLVVQLLVILVGNMSELDRSDDWSVHDYGMDVMRQPLEPDAAIVGILGEVTLVRYFQETEGLRPDLVTIAADREDERLATVAGLLEEGQTVYLTRELPGAPARWSLSAVGPLSRVIPQPVLDAPDTPYFLGTSLIPEITLYGCAISRPPNHSGVFPVRLSLVWQAAAPITRELKVSVRLLNADGQPVAQADAVPVHFAYPTTAWRPGEFISDVYDLSLPSDLQPGEYTPVIILYDPVRGAAEVGRVMLPPILLP